MLTPTRETGRIHGSRQRNLTQSRTVRPRPTFRVRVWTIPLDVDESVNTGAALVLNHAERARADGATAGLRRRRIMVRAPLRTVPSGRRIADGWTATVVLESRSSRPTRPPAVIVQPWALPAPSPERSPR